MTGGEQQDKTVRIGGAQKSLRLCLSCSRTFEPGKHSTDLSGLEATCPHDGSALLVLPEVDAPLVGNYLFKGLLGVGGMGVVFKALNPYLDRLVAIKFVKGKRYDSKQLQRFMQEGKLLSKLVHPNLVSVLDFGANSEGEPYMVMEYLDGQSLAQMIDKVGIIPMQQTLEILIQTCEGLAHAHKFGAVHRDIKPSNIFISESGRGKLSVKLLDFGIAKLCFPEDPVSSADLTRTGEIFGSPLYMSPEQALSKTVDERSDLYNLGCVMYEMLTGLPPHVGATAMETIFKHVSDSPQPLSKSAPKKNYPVSIQELLTCLLAKDPADRIESAEKLAELLSCIGSEDSAGLRELSQRARRLGARAAAQGRTAGAVRGRGSEATSHGLPELSTAFKIGGAVSVLLLAVGGGAYFLFKPAVKTASPVVAQQAPPKTAVELDTNDTTSNLLDMALRPDAKTLEVVTKKELSRGGNDYKVEHRTLTRAAFEIISKQGQQLAGVTFRIVYGLNAGNLACLQNLAITRAVIEYGDLDDGGLAALAKIPTLRSISLRECADLTPLALLGLKPTHLNSLRVEGIKVHEKVWKEILPQPYLATLELLASPKADSVTQVHVFKCRAAAPLIGRCPALRELSLVATDLTSDDIVYLRSLKDLWRLSLANSHHIDDRAIDSLLKLNNLKDLDMGGTAITGAGVERLLKNSHLQKMRISARFGRTTPYIEQQLAAGRLYF
ncbi:MAG: serine/threonine protein kinase [Cyanobacteria bacterium SZAS LIN-3]|nr:serine/threonine protein kinase [Cyanobacteria bacterium SZAS LIN-3]